MSNFKKDDVAWIVWGLGTCIFFGMWQESLYAGLFCFYLIIFVLSTIAGWEDEKQENGNE